MSRAKRITLIAVALVLLSFVTFMVFRNRAEAPGPNNETSERQQANGDQEFDKTRHSISEPGSPWWIINKERPLPAGYVPPELTVPNVRLRLGSGEEQMKLEPRTAEALEEMFAAAKADGVELMLSSGYRSEALQRQFYNNYVAQHGQEAADRFSARPGTSEHQTGMAADVMPPSGECALEVCFADIPEGEWVTANAHKYGFISRYPENKEQITGYQYEPWHLRYVGTELAEQLHKTSQTMEELFGLVTSN